MNFCKGVSVSVICWYKFFVGIGLNKLWFGVIFNFDIGLFFIW